MEKLLPHSGNMIFIDEVIEQNNEFIITKTIIKEDNSFLENGYFLSNCFLEIMAQSVGAHAGHRTAKEGKEPKIGFLLGCRKLEFFKNKVSIGACLVTKARISMEDESGFGIYDCKIFENDEIIVCGKLSVISPSEEYLKKVINNE